MYPDAGGTRPPTAVDMAAQLADLGYAVLVPDVYYRSGDWAPFDMETVFSDKSERQRLFSMIGSVTPPDAMASDARAFFDYLAARPPEVTGETFGTTGYCMGGRTSLTVAGRVPNASRRRCRFTVAAWPPTIRGGSPHLLADQITAAVYVGGAQNDASFTKAQAKTLDDALTAASVEHTIEWYPAEHGFAVPDNGPYDEAAAKRHWDAMKDFFGRT